MNDKLLQIFKEASGSYVSGEQISKELGISRTAVWKRIRKLEEEGYVFHSMPRLGYQLLRAPERIQLEALRARLSGTPFGNDIQWFDTVHSTQDVAHQALLAGGEEGTIILAETQTAGRGRLGRAFYSPPGKSIYMSVLLKPDVPLQRAPQMTLLLSVALCRAIRKETGANATIKWPNDILIEGRKVVGILVETILEANTVKAMVAGIGINTNMRERDFPEELREKATSLMEAAGKPVSREALIGEFFEQFGSLYELYKSEGFAPIKVLWEALTSTLHNAVEVTSGTHVVRGVAEAITEEGALLVRDAEGKLHTMYSGELARTLPA